METCAIRSIAIDVREACRERKTGKGQWVTGFVGELLLRDVKIILITDADVPKEWSGRTQLVRIPGSGFLWHWNVRSWLKKNPDVVYLSTTSFLVPVLASRFTRIVPVVHDLIAWLPEPHDRKARWMERLLLPFALKKSAHVFAISDATKRDLLARFPSLSPAQVSPLYAGPMHPHPPLNVSDGKTIACIGTLCPRKNQRRLIEAYATLAGGLRQTTEIVIAGARGWDDDEIVQLAETVPGVRYESYVTPKRYEELLSSCAVFALPSLYEGFGMQILDALQRGCVVLTSDRGSLHELAQGVALIVDPESVQAIADGLKRLLTDGRLRSDLRQKGRECAAAYSWRRTVDLALAALQKRGLLQ